MRRALIWALPARKRTLPVAIGNTKDRFKPRETIADCGRLLLAQEAVQRRPDLDSGIDQWVTPRHIKPCLYHQFGPVIGTKQLARLSDKPVFEVARGGGQGPRYRSQQIDRR